MSRSDESGAVAIIVALLALTLFGFAALVVDIGNADSVHEQGQSAVDDAALAGVRALAAGGMEVDVADAVKQYVAANIGVTDWAGCKDPTPLAVIADTDVTDTCISTLMSTTPGITSYQVRVKLPPMHVPSTFGGLFGVSSITVSPLAQALSGQPLPPECGPCDPALDESTGQPMPQAAPTGLPAAIRAMLPDPTLTDPADPNTVPPAGPLDPMGSGCPTTPGLFTPTNFPDGVTIGPNPLIPVACTLHPGLYVFDDVNVDVTAVGSLASTLSDGTDGQPPLDTGVTLVFYGKATLTVEGHIGTLLNDAGGPRAPLTASEPDVVWQPGQPIPGVAIVLDQCSKCDQSNVQSRTFSLGDDFQISGSVYALDGQTTWATASGDCMPDVPAVATCTDKDLPDGRSVIATTATAFSDPNASNVGRIPTVATDHPMVEPPPSAPHLVK